MAGKFWPEAQSYFQHKPVQEEELKGLEFEWIPFLDYGQNKELRNMYFHHLLAFFSLLIS